MLPLISWFIALVLLGNAAWMAWTVFRADNRVPALLLSAAGNLVFTLALANMATVEWNSTVPIALWWLTALLLAVYLGGLAHRVLTRTPAPCGHRVAARDTPLNSGQG